MLHLSLLFCQKKNWQQTNPLFFHAVFQSNSDIFIPAVYHLFDLHREDIRAKCLHSLAHLVIHFFITSELFSFKEGGQRLWNMLECCVKFASGHSVLTDALCSGSPPTLISTVLHIIHDALRYHIVGYLGAEAIECRSEGIAMWLILTHLQCYAKVGHKSFSGIVTSNEIWVCHFTQISKAALVAWKHTIYPMKKKFKTMQSAGRHCWWHFVTHMTFFSLSC